MADGKILHGDILNAPVDIDPTTITVTTVEALQMALEDCDYYPVDKIHALRRRLIRIRHILRQAVDWLKEEDMPEPEPGSAEALLDAFYGKLDVEDDDHPRPALGVE